MELHKLTKEEKRVIIDKGTEAPFVGEYVNNTMHGVYVCRQCRAPLYRSKDKFQSDCGWPSFDDEIANAIQRVPDADGIRTEISCARCGGHLGHVFEGERLTDNNVRHCVNSLSLKFMKERKMIRKAYFAGGCFWGLQEFMRSQAGVLHTTAGYTGGENMNPTYEHHPGHAEALEIEYDTEITCFWNLLDFFFQIHNPTTLNQQGNDVGTSYRSAVFYQNDEELKQAQDFITIVNDSKRWDAPVVTTLEPLKKFWPAEDNHQDYLQKNPSGYTCHSKYFDSYLH